MMLGIVTTVPKIWPDAFEIPVLMFLVRTRLRLY